MEVFFKRQGRHVNVPSDGKWCTRRTISLFCPPDDSDWLAPPSFETVQREFKFDIRPDCNYWLSLAGFNPKYRGEVGNAVYLHRNVITCPYLTIEFKKQNESAEQARVQAPAAASVALYNRFLLKNKALDITKTNGQTLKRIKCGTTSLLLWAQKLRSGSLKLILMEMVIFGMDVV